MMDTRKQRNKRRLSALIDGSAWLMMAPALTMLYWLDPAMAKSIMQWCLPSVALAGMAIIVSRLTFPQLHIDDLLEGVRRGNTASATVLAAVVAFVAVVFLALVLWAKA